MVDHRADVVEPARRTGRGLARRRRRSTERASGLTFGPWPREASAVVDHGADVVEPLDVGQRGGRRRGGHRGKARRTGRGLARRRRSTGRTSSSRLTSGRWPREASAVVDLGRASSSRSSPGPRKASAGRRSGRRRRAVLDAAEERGGSTSRPSQGVGGRPSADVVEPLDVQAVASRGVGGRPPGRRRRAARRPGPRKASAVDHRADVVEPLDAGAKGGGRRRGRRARRRGAGLARRRWWSTIGPTSSSRSTRGRRGASSRGPSARRPGRSTREAAAVDHRADVVERLDVAGRAKPR